MKLVMLPWILLGILFNVGAQLALKAGVNRFGAFSVTWANLISLSWHILLNPWVLFSIFIYIFSIAIWIFVLSRVDVSIAYPFLSLGYVLNTVAAHYWLHERFTFLRIFGVVVILLGVFIITKE
jgi:multidrug transporter EmrE-like cation transporter